MLNNQSKLHTLLKINNPSAKERDQILKLIRTGKYDLPECAFEQAFTLLKNNSESKNSKFYNNEELFHTSDLIRSGLELQIGSKLKGYLQKFKQALGDVPAIKKLTAFIDFTLSTEPNSVHFDDLIMDDKTDFDSRKQSISTLKVFLMITQATYEWDDYVESLNQYLKENPNDYEAWLELGDIYTEKSQYLRALFCYEEVVVLCPENDYYFLHLAELYYTDGGKANIAIAVKYFSYVISRNPKNPRALWGLYRSLWTLRDNLDETDKQLMEKTKETIQKLYSQKNPSLKIHLAL